MALPDAAKIAEYLDSGYVVLDVMERLPDVLDGEVQQATASIVTDGVWVWREDFRHYFVKHRVPLPHLFLEHVRQSQFQMPRLTKAELIDLTPAILQAWRA